MACPGSRKANLATLVSPGDLTAPQLSALSQKGPECLCGWNPAEVGGFSAPAPLPCTAPSGWREGAAHSVTAAVRSAFDSLLLLFLVQTDTAEQ